MAHLQYFNYPNYGVKMRVEYGYSQAVRIGNRIECSGQGRNTRDSRSPRTLDS